MYRSTRCSLLHLLRRAIVTETGTADKITLEDLPLPSMRLAPGELLVRNAFAGVNFIDTYYRSGLYPKLSYPFGLGQEGCGAVVQAGPSLEKSAWLNRRVVYADCLSGSYSSFAKVRAHDAYSVPEGVEDKSAAAIFLQGATAHYLTHDTHPVKPSDRVLVHAAAGGTGLLVSQMAKLRGAQLVVGVVGSAEKAEIARSVGKCDIAVDYTTTPDWKSAIQEQLGGDKFNVVYDAVGKSAFLPSLDLLKPRGHMVTFGNASGAVEPFSPLILNQKGSLWVTRPKLGDYMLTRQEGEARIGELLDMVKSGKLTVTIDRTFKLGDVADAHRYLENKKAIGKILINTQE